MAIHGAMTKTAKLREFYGDSWRNAKNNAKLGKIWRVLMARTRGGGA